MLPWPEHLYRSLIKAISPALNLILYFAAATNGPRGGGVGWSLLEIARVTAVDHWSSHSHNAEKERYHIFTGLGYLLNGLHCSSRFRCYAQPICAGLIGHFVQPRVAQHLAGATLLAIPQGPSVSARMRSTLG